MRFPSKAGLKRRGLAAAIAVQKGVGRARTSTSLRQAKWPVGSKVHLGCGPVHLDGWVNIDINKAVNPDVRVDLRFGFPAPPASVKFIFSEHVFEHFTLEAGSQLFADCFLALLPGGVMRIAMPDLRYLVDSYLGNWRDQAWLAEPAYDVIDTPAHMLNFALRSWEHLYIYDIEDLTLRQNQAGFKAVASRQWGKSQFPELTGLEQRSDSLLIVEATK
jgi:predicted SAM-dependent methyltransferase